MYLLLLCCLAVEVAAADAYTAAVWSGEYGNMRSSEYGNMRSSDALYPARAEKADIMVLPSKETDAEHYDEVVRELSGAARRGALYLVAPLTLRPQRGVHPGDPAPAERTTLVFDRQGAILAVSRKPLCNVSNNTALPAPRAAPASFTTDFGVKFLLLAEEELVFGAPPGHERNVVLAGACRSEIPYFNAAQFTASWAYTHCVNVLTAARGPVAGLAGPLTPETRGPPTTLALFRLDDNCDESIATPPVISPASLLPPAQPPQHVVRYVVRGQLAGRGGYSDTVCHNAFCCQFYLKTRPTAITGAQSDVVSVGLAAFEGARRLAGSAYIGAQDCAVFACNGLYKRTCGFGSVTNSTDLIFEKLSISANYSHETTVPYPVILSHRRIPPEHFEYVTTSDGHIKSVKMTVTDADRLLAFGAFGRVFERDYDSRSESEDSVDLYNYIFNDDVHEFFDYLWIRVRILMVVVSIYVLEMM